MDLTLLEHFLVIAEVQSFTKAANILDKSESVLSRQMSRLESELGFSLFDRSSRRITLTPAAKVFYTGVDEVIGKYHQAVSDAMDIHRGASGIVRLGMVENHLLPDKILKLLDEFRTRYPKIQIRIEPRDMLALRSALSDDQIDLFYSATMAYQDDSDLSVLPCGKVQNYLVISRDHPAAAQDPAHLCLADFRNDKFIARANYPYFIQQFTQTCARAGFLPRFLPAGNQTQMLTLVQMNAGVIIIDDTHFFIKNSDVCRIPLPELSTLDFGFTYDPTNLSNCCKVFLDFIAPYADASALGLSTD